MPLSMAAVQWVGDGIIGIAVGKNDCADEADLVRERRVNRSSHDSEFES